MKRGAPRVTAPHISGDLFNEMTSFLQESVLNGFHTTLLATGDLGRRRAPEQYVIPECQQFPIRRLNRTHTHAGSETVHGICPAIQKAQSEIKTAD